jgi:hypothetical protein
MSDANADGHPLERFWKAGGVLHVAADGQMLFPASGRCPPARVLLPGSFSPMHSGHWELARVAAMLLGHPVAFELSAVNVDKPNLTPEQIRRRLLQFNWQASVWLTKAARFVEKAECFPGATFVVGADTALRIVLPRYYDNDETRMLAVLARLSELECRFLVACRVDAQGKYWRVGDLPIPPAFRDRFEEIPPEQFRKDLSSTKLRALSGTA